MRQSDSFLPATGSQGNVVGYDKVIESFGVNRENGHSEYDFENEPDVILPAYYPHGSLVRKKPETSIGITLPVLLTYSSRTSSTVLFNTPLLATAS